jgi:hypothetical protein
LLLGFPAAYTFLKWIVMAKSKKWLEGFAKSLGNKPRWSVFVSRTEVQLGLRCLGCYRFYRCKPGVTLICKPCGLSYQAPPTIEEVKRTVECKKFFQGIGLDKLVFHRDEIKNEHSYGTTRTLDYVEEDFGS